MGSRNWFVQDTAVLCTQTLFTYTSAFWARGRCRTRNVRFSAQAFYITSRGRLVGSALASLAQGCGFDFRTRTLAILALGRPLRGGAAYCVAPVCFVLFSLMRGFVLVHNTRRVRVGQHTIQRNIYFTKNKQHND